MRQSEGLAIQLATARHEVAKVAPAARDVSDLQVREKDAHYDTHEAEEKVMALIKRVHMDAMEVEWLWKE